MRRLYPDFQKTFFQSEISDVDLNPYCKDEISEALHSIKEIHSDPTLCNKILKLIQFDLSLLNKDNSVQGANGMSCWELFTLLILRRTGITDYHQLSNLASNHRALRELIYLGPCDYKGYPKSTVQENIVKIMPHTINKINDLIIAKGHEYIDNPFSKLRCDSFVFETNIHFHSDYQCIYDGIRCVLREGGRLSKLISELGFRQFKHLQKKAKQLARSIGLKKKAGGKTTEEKKQDIDGDYMILLTYAKWVVDKALAVLDKALNVETQDESLLKTIKKVKSKLVFFLSGTAIEMELAERRQLKNELLSPSEKIFSIFEAHTELIMKGKVKAPMEFGHRVIVSQDMAGFITGKRMESGYTDSEICVDFIKDLQKRFECKIDCVTFDKGFFSKENKTELEGIVETVILPSKGKKTKEEKESHDESYYENKNWHSGIESAISCLERGNNLGLCLDKGLEGFDRCVAASILARNLQTLGKLLMKREREKIKHAA